MGQLARELGVDIRTIRSDITVLTVKYPLDTIRGNGGCVKVADGYHPHKNILSREQETVLTQLLVKTDESERKVLREMLTAFGSPAVREQYAKEANHPWKPQ